MQVYPINVSLHFLVSVHTLFLSFDKHCFNECKQSTIQGYKRR